MLMDLRGFAGRDVLLLGSLFRENTAPDKSG